jgi:hypothetical protein
MRPESLLSKVRRQVQFLPPVPLLVVACAVVFQSCSANPTVLDFYTIQTPEERRAASEYFQNQAVRFRQQANEMAERAETYRQLFGEDSEWVNGTRLLSEYYEREAQERERRAAQYRLGSSPFDDPDRPAHLPSRENP